MTEEQLTAIAKKVFAAGTKGLVWEGYTNTTHTLWKKIVRAAVTGLEEGVPREELAGYVYEKYPETGGRWADTSQEIRNFWEGYTNVAVTEYLLTPKEPIP